MGETPQAAIAGTASCIAASGTKSAGLVFEIKGDIGCSGEVT